MIRIRSLDAGSPAEVDLVAGRMRATLAEVLGRDTGESMYSMDWLRRRVLWHLDPECCTGAVFLAEDADGTIRGHGIVRVEAESGGEVGLFSTTYVQPEARGKGVATGLLRHGEHWMRERGLGGAVTYTAATNDKLIGLYRKHGYGLTPTENDMVRLFKPLQAEA